MTTDVHTDPDSGVRIAKTRFQRVTNTVTLRVSDYCGEFWLDDLRRLVAMAEDLPGGAIVQPRSDGIDITYLEDVPIDDAEVVQ